MQFLDGFLDAPSNASVDRALQVLHSLNAIDREQNITALGKHIAELPLDVRLAKLLIFGAVLQCVDPVLTIAACMVRVCTVAIATYVRGGRSTFSYLNRKCCFDSNFPSTGLPVVLSQSFGQTARGKRGENALLHRKE